jgi:rSAM/selenodomain-associated transferase 1
MNPPSSCFQAMPRPVEAIVVFAKAPEPGKVKTRLIGLLSPQQAADLHDACIEDMLHEFEWTESVRRELHVTGSKQPIHILLRDTGLTHKWKLERQRGRGLGARMRRAFERLFARGMQRVVIVGTDTPWMSNARVDRAFKHLKSVDAVLGPCEDGGYYLIGLRRTIPEIFNNIDWGTKKVLRQSIYALRQCGASYRLLPRDFDLDRPGDLRRALHIRRRISQNTITVGAWLKWFEKFRKSSRRRSQFRRNKTRRPGRA